MERVSTQPPRPRRLVVHLFADPAVATTFAEAGGQGVIVPWREVLTLGWTPSSCDLSTWIAVRARELSRHLGVRRRHVAAALRRQERILAQVPEEGEVVLWAGPDLSCQIVLWAWLFRLHSRRQRPTLSVVSAPEVGTSRAPCLASLSGERLLAVARARRVLTPVEIKLGAQAWKVLGDRDPTGMRRSLESSWSSILGISRGLHLQLLRFPEPDTGMGAVERKILELVGGGVRSEHELHRAMSARACAYGLSAAELRLEVRRLSSGRRAPLSGAPRDLRITRYGLHVLDGRDDLVRLVGAPRAIGGTELGRDGDWRYDPGAGELVR